MSLVYRAKNLILTPKTEWAVVAGEEPNADVVFLRYALPLIIVSASATFVGYAFIRNEGFNDTAFNRGLYFGIQTLLIGALGLWLTAIVINALAQNFGSEKNIGRAMQLIAYSMTPVWIGGLLMIYPPIGFIGLLFGLYGLYLLYLGLPQMMKTPHDKIGVYSGFSIVILLVICIALGFIYWIILWDIIVGIFKSVLINSHPLK